MKVWPFSTLRNPEAPLPLVVLSGWATATIPALLLVLVAQQILPPEMFERVGDEVWSDELPVWANVGGVVLFAPVVETLMMAIGFALMSLVRVPPGWQIAAQTVAWGILHGSIAAAWGIAPTWIFFVLSVIWIGQRPASWWKSFFAVTLVHMLNNALAAIDLVRTQAGG
ncbi:hypothetical protein [Parvularcula maris]|uniref:Uncharacterized protein n=1 Tax=Parvularcula maris TaxID=2965077 RepID=A0A9X2L7R5_9PROT|nr:hypothetical protein [Parvularcula maris]MCQ8184587.1 hypothetical protein [Parvularcula maris]